MSVIIEILESFVFLLLSDPFPHLSMIPTVGIFKIIELWNVSAGKELKSPTASPLILQKWK